MMRKHYAKEIYGEANIIDVSGHFICNMKYSARLYICYYVCLYTPILVSKYHLLFFSIFLFDCYIYCLSYCLTAYLSVNVRKQRFPGINSRFASVWKL